MYSFDVVKVKIIQVYRLQVCSVRECFKNSKLQQTHYTAQYKHKEQFKDKKGTGFRKKEFKYTNVIYEQKV